MGAMAAPVPFTVNITPGQIDLTVDGAPITADGIRFEQAPGEIGHLSILQPVGAMRLDGIATVSEIADPAEIIVDFLTGIDIDALGHAALDSLTGQTITARTVELLIEAANQ